MAVGTLARTARMCRKSGTRRGVIPDELAAGSIKPNNACRCGRWVLITPGERRARARAKANGRHSGRLGEARPHVCRASGTWERGPRSRRRLPGSPGRVSPRQAITTSGLVPWPMLCPVPDAAALGAVPGRLVRGQPLEGACSPRRRRSGGAGVGQGPATGGSAPAPGRPFPLTWPRTPGPGRRIRCDRPAGHARRAGSSATRSSGATAAVRLCSRMWRAGPNIESAL